MEPTAELPIRRYLQGRFEETRDLVVVEEPLEIRLAGEPFQVLMRLPGLEKELALGFLFTEGIIKNLSEVITLHFCGTATDPLLPPNVVDVSLTEVALARRGRRHLEVAYSSCGLCAKEAVSEIRRQLAPLKSTLAVTAEELFSLMTRMQEAQSIFRATGGSHGAALAAPGGGPFLMAEDVGRHNALDKVIGKALLQKRDPTVLVALLSGRISFEMVLKAARASIPILAAVSAPTTMALELARELHLTLAGFVRDRRLNIYSHPERIRT